MVQFVLAFNESYASYATKNTFNDIINIVLKVEIALQSLREVGAPPKFVIIDDGDEAPSLELRIVNFIKQDKRLYEKILRFETIELASLHKNLQLNQIKIGKKDLQGFLDQKGIINSW